MTPFGEKLRQIRRARSISQKEMAAAIGVSPAYLSALEHGHRGVPNWAMVQKIIGYFNIIWDDAEELEQLAAGSNPRVVLDTAGMNARTTLLANRLAGAFRQLSDSDIARIEAVLDRVPQDGDLLE
jgi:transcriptional regulator with XRE-family HTH domain